MGADREAVGQTNSSPPARVSSPTEELFERCQKLLDDPERETDFARTGLSFWCAYAHFSG